MEVMVVMVVMELRVVMEVMVVCTVYLTWFLGSVMTPASLQSTDSGRSATSLLEPEPAWLICPVCFIKMSVYYEAHQCGQSAEF